MTQKGKFTYQRTKGRSTKAFVEHIEDRIEEFDEAVKISLANFGVDPAFISYDGELPDSEGAEVGTKGAYFKDETKVFQILEWDGDAWVEIGSPIITVEGVEASVALAQAWAEGTEPGGAGTKSAKEHSEDADARATAAGISETNAGISETNAGLSEAKAEQWAEEDEDVEVESGQYSSKHHSAKAAQYAASTFANMGVDTDFISYDDSLPDSSGAVVGTKGAYFKDNTSYQVVEWDGAAWQEIGQPIETVTGANLKFRGVCFADGRDGSDSNDGRTAKTAMKTINAAKLKMNEGDVLKVRSGIVYREFVDFRNFRGCTIEQFGGGTRPVISAHDVITSFTQHEATNAYTFTIYMPTLAGGQFYVAAFEDGLWLNEVIVGRDSGINTEADAIDHVVNNPGTFYFAGNGTQLTGITEGDQTYYIHPIDSDDPNTNGRVYTAIARSNSAYLDDNIWRGFVFEAGWHPTDLHVGAYVGGPIVENCAQLYTHRHASLFNEAVMDDFIVALPNPRMYSTLIHTNPTTGITQPTKGHVLRNVKAIGAGVIDDVGYGQTGVYCHGDFDPDNVQKDGVLIIDSYVQDVGVVCNAPDAAYLKAVRLKARKFRSITAGASRVNEFYDCNMVSKTWHHDASGISPASGSRAIVKGGYYDLAARHFYRILSGQHGGAIEVDDATIILRTPRYHTTITMFGLTSTANTIDGISLKRTTLMLSEQGRDALLVLAGTLSSFEAEDLVFINWFDSSENVQRDPILRIGGVNYTLSEYAPNVRAIWQDASRVIAEERDGETIWKKGAYRPGMDIYSDVAYSMHGNQWPRCFVAVGDRLMRFNYQYPAGYEDVENIPEHLNAVTFCNSGNNTRAFIAGGNNGLMYTSNEWGVSWTTVTSNTDKNIYGIAGHTNGVVVAVGEDGMIIRSTNTGDTWAAASNNGGVATDLLAVATDGTTWIAVGVGGVVLTSTDGGDNWSSSTVGGDDHYAVFWHSSLNLFFLGSDGGNIRTSPAGTISWTSRTTNVQHRVKSFAQTPAGVVAALYQTRYNFGSSFLTSLDGIVWEPSKTVLPFDVGGVAGTGTAHNGSHGLMAVGESRYIATARNMNENWEISSPFHSDESLSRHSDDAMLAEIGRDV
jgi:hypothetical protein